KHEQYRHSYPFCPRAENDPLIQYARKSWFIRTSDFRDRFLANNAGINWQPGHIRDGRFGNFLENNVDWALSRERFWGTPLPIWICEKTGHMECVASYAELLAKPGVAGVDVWEAAKQADPSLRDDLRVHKPYIDAVTYQSPKDPSARMRRVTEVIDVWYDAGSMPFAQWGYPHVPGSEELLAGHFPADFISEGLDQTRGWFYALLAISTLMFGEDRSSWPHPFKNCICLGLVHGEDGLKLSKRLKNYKDPNELFDQYSADALRWSLISKNPPTTGIRMTERNVEEAQREMLIRWHNVYSFFVIYANLDGFSPCDAPAEFLAALGCDPAAVPSPAAPAERPAWRPAADRCELDRWILNELARTVVEVRSALDQYETYPAARALSSFLDGLSNWYVRRSRSRFWAGAWSADKTDAYWTLYECLLTFAQLMAPFTPFYAEATWRNLAAPLPGVPESVHMSDFPRAAAEAIDWALITDMGLTREAVTLGLNARRTANLKVRQPLGLCEIVLSDASRRHALETHRDLILEELNIKELAFAANPDEYVTYLVKPNFKVLGPKHGQNVKRIGQLLSEGSGAAFFAQMRDAGRIMLSLDGREVELGPDDVEVRLQPREGFSAAQSAEMVVVLSTEITEELRHEGWVRDFVRVVQDMRKEMNVAYDARITLAVCPQTPELAEVLRRFEAAISETVLAREIVFADSPGEGARMAETEGGGVSVLVSL
ncbi:MAG TPA: class I tRNA ligase family protein, partial [Candidatus Hydrogenedentes bacterium]|nr:class I tRNA ligase family protein [Candidatus Hydrogenedentota bacterium]